jgi:sn-glycerol 3-phosphate transport system ATP-binding protein
MLGAERLLYCKISDEYLIVRADEGTVAPQIGQTLHILPRADRVHQFDAASGKRIAA